MCAQGSQKEEEGQLRGGVSIFILLERDLSFKHLIFNCRYPLYATTAPDETDPEEILTYEEVALYYPRATHKRPIVLIGPPNIGRHELRQRLMADSERFSAAVPRK